MGLSDNPALLGVSTPRATACSQALERWKSPAARAGPACLTPGLESSVENSPDSCRHAQPDAGNHDLRVLLRSAERGNFTGRTTGSAG